MSNGYPPKRKRGIIDKRQHAVSEAKLELIRYTLRHSPSLNIAQIARKVPELRNEWAKLVNYPEDIKKEVLKGNPQRSTVRKHVQELVNTGEIELVMGKYVPTWMRTEVADKLNQPVRDLLSTGYLENRNFTHAMDVAACYVSSDPKESHEQFYHLWKTQIDRFGDSLFWLDDIVKWAMVNDCVSPQVYSEKRGLIKMDKLIEGLRRYFGQNRLFVLSMAISPPKLFEFLEDPVGKALATQYLKREWQNILNGVKLQHEKEMRNKKKWRRDR
jgi:hypothetical protein